MAPPRIFVQIPAYRDSELASTLWSLYAKARHPERLRVCVAWQHAPEETLPEAVRALPNLEILDIPHERSRGCNWARRKLQRRWRGEPYTLLLDSHQRFVSEWDALTLAMYRGLRRRGVARPIITAYLPAYDPRREPGGRRKRPYKIYPFEREGGLLLRLTSYPIPSWTALREPIPAAFASLHFLFTAGQFNRDVPFDPEIYFFGDEVLTGLRAFTRGYDLFHPHVIVGWHCYDRATRLGHWHDHPRWHEQNRRSLAKLARLFRRGDSHARGRRTVADYEEHIMTKLIA